MQVKKDQAYTQIPEGQLVFGIDDTGIARPLNVNGSGEVLVSGAGGSGSAAAIRNDAAASNLAAANGIDSKIAVDQQGKAFIAGSYVEDTAHTGADRGLFLLGVRNDTTTVLTSANNDYSPIATDPYGAVKVALGITNVAGGDTNASAVKSLYWGLTTGQAGVATYGVNRNDKTQTVRGGSDLGAMPGSCDSYGRQYVTTGVGPQEGAVFVSAVVSTLGNNTLGSAFGAGVRWYVTEITFENQDGAGHNHMTLSDGTTVFASATIPSQQTVHVVFNQPRRTVANGTFTLNLSHARSSKVTVGGFQLTV